MKTYVLYGQVVEESSPWLIDDFEKLGLAMQRVGEITQDHFCPEEKNPHILTLKEKEYAVGAEKIVFRATVYPDHS